MELTCVECNKFCGTVRDATLRKGIVILCSACNEKRRPVKLKKESEKSTSNSLDEIFGKVFGGRI